ncbi:hypothetical protein KSF78_0007202 [Schistosoma japonicum]|nr:hypothetical protein KSF78_0007202 [Schistosoma japonicum]
MFPTDENSQVNISNYFQKCFKPEFDVNKPSKITEFVYKINSYLLLCTIFLSNFGILLLDKLPEETTIRMQVKIPIWIFIGLMILISAIICSILAKQPENQTAVSFKVSQSTSAMDTGIVTSEKEKNEIPCPRYLMISSFLVLPIPTLAFRSPIEMIKSLSGNFTTID